MSSTSLYEAHQEAFDQIGVHKPSISEMSKHFSSFTEMELALCYGPSVVSKWVQKRNGISQDAEKRAKNWLDAKISNAKSDDKSKSSTGKVLLVACSDQLAEKAIKILSLLGCDVTEI